MAYDVWRSIANKTSHDAFTPNRSSVCVRLVLLRQPVRPPRGTGAEGDRDPEEGAAGPETRATAHQDRGESLGRVE